LAPGSRGSGKLHRTKRADFQWQAGRISRRLRRAARLLPVSGARDMLTALRKATSGVSPPRHARCLRACAALWPSPKCGVDLSAAHTKRRVFCRPCVDWTKRRPHIGAAIASRCLDLKWIEPVGGSRALTITAADRWGLMSVLGLSV
jgi:hypothetical protein